MLDKIPGMIHFFKSLGILLQSLSPVHCIDLRVRYFFDEGVA